PARAGPASIAAAAQAAASARAVLAPRPVVRVDADNAPLLDRRAPNGSRPAPDRASSAPRRPPHRPGAPLIAASPRPRWGRPEEHDHESRSTPVAPASHP